MIPEEFEAVFGQDQYERQLAARRQAEHGELLSESPDQHAVDMQLAADTGLPVPAVQRGRDTLQLRREQTKRAQQIYDSPSLQRYLAAKPERYGVYKDDLPATSLIGQMSQVLRSSWANALANDVYFGIFTRGPDAQPTPAERDQLERLHYQARWAGENYGRTGISSVPLSLARFLPSIGGGFLRAQQYGAATAGVTAGLTALAGQAGPQAALPEEVVTVPAAAAAGYAAGGLVGFLEFAFRQETGGALAEYSLIRDETTGQRLDPLAAWTAAFLTGSVAGGAEALGGKVLWNAAGGKKLIAMMARDPMRKALARPSMIRAFAEFGRRYMGTVTAETATEIFQEAAVMYGGELAKAATEGMDRAGRMPDQRRRFARLTGEEWSERLEETGREAFKGVLLIPLGGAASRAMIDGYEVRRAREHEQQVRELVEKTEQSPVYKRYKDELEQWIQTRAEQGGDPTTYVDAAGITAYAHSVGINPMDILDQLGVSAAEVSDAVKRRGDLLVPLSKLTTGLAENEHRDGVLKNLREHPGAPTPLETELLINQEQELFERAQQEQGLDDAQMAELAESAERVRADIEARIRSIPEQDAETASFQAQLWHSFFRTQAALHGMDPWDLYQRWQTTIQTEDGEGLQVGGEGDLYYQRGKKDPTVALADETPGLAGILPHLTRDEQAKLNRGTAKKLVDLFERLPDAEEMASVAWSGRAKRGWYRESAHAIVEIFGLQDAPRFTALLAAFSPRTSVEIDATNTLRVWTAWNDKGRPTDPKVLMEIMAENVSGEKGEASVLGSWRNNAIAALTAEDPTVVLSGPKVQSFMENLLGNVVEVTNDGWMANYALIEAGDWFGGKRGKTAGREDGGKRPGYLAMSALTRQAAQILSERTGEEWTPAEVQETVWSWTKALYEKAVSGKTAHDLVTAAGLTEDDIAATPDFATLFTTGIYRRILEVGGYGEQVEAVGERAAAQPPATGEPTSAEGAGVPRSAFERDIERAAERIDELKRRRALPAEHRAREIFQDALAYKQQGRDRTVAGALAAPYRRGDRGSSAGSLVAKEIGAGHTYTPYHPHPRLTKELRRKPVGSQKKKRSVPTILEVTDPALFRRAMKKAVKTQPFGEAVWIYSEEEYAGMRLFLTEDMQAGIALKGDDIVSLFSTKGGNHTMVKTALQFLAQQEGGRRSDQYDPALPRQYAPMGRRVVARIAWNDEYAPEGWDKEKYADLKSKRPDGTETAPGEPDVTYAVYDPEYLAEYEGTEGQLVETEEEAVRLQNEAIAEIEARGHRRVNRPFEEYYQPGQAVEEEAPRGVTRFADGRALMTLFQGRDMSTILHEGGHIFLKIFEGLATDPNAPVQTQRDWETLVSAARKARPGTDPDRTLTEEQVEWIVEEQWEKRYLARGVAPSTDLAGAFNSFRAWMLQIYQWLRGQNVDMDPEIAAVFDRWLATEQEISALEGSKDYRPLWSSQEQSGKTDAEWADYQERVRRVHLAAHSESISEAIEAEQREERRWWRAQREQVEASVTEEVNAEPVHQASHWLRTGEWLAGEPAMEVPPVKLSRQWIVDTYGREGAKPFLAALARGKGKLYQTEEGGLTGDEAAELFGFESGDHLLRALAAAPDRERVIRDETEGALRGLAETRENAPQRAVDAMHTDVRGELLAQELAWLAEQGLEISEEHRVAPPAAEEGAPAAEQEPAGTLGEDAEEFSQPGREPTKTELALRKARDEARERAAEAEARLKAARGASARAWGAAARRARGEAQAEVVDVRRAIKVNVNEARAEAQRRVLELQLGKLRPDSYSGTERRAANECQEAILRLQDPRTPLEARAELIDQAIEAQRVRLVNHFMYREARKAKVQTEKDRRWLLQFQEDKKRAEFGKAGGRPRGYLDRIDELMEKFDLKAKPTNEEVEIRQRFDQWIQQEEKDGHEILYPDRFVVGGMPWKQMTVKDMYDLRDTVKHLDKQAKLKRKLLSHKDARDRDEAASELAGRAYQTHTALAVKPKDSDELSFLEKTREFMGGMDASLLKIEQLIDWLDGKDPNGPWRRLIWNPIADAQAHFYKIVDEKVLQFQLIMKHLDERDTEWLQKKIHARELTDREHPGGKSFRGYQLIAMACNLGTESNAKKLLKAYNWEISDVMRVLDRELSDEHWEVVQRIWDLLEGMWDDIATHEKAISGLAPEKLTRRTFQTASGRTMRGGYYPMVYDHMANNRIYHYQQAADALYEYNWTKPETNHSHTHKRTDHFSAPLLFDLQTVPNHLARVAHDLSHRHVLMDAHNLLSHPDVQSAVKDTLGQPYADLFLPWLKGIANNVSPDRELAGWEKALRHMRYNTTIMAMGWKATTMFSQVAGYFNSLEWLLNHGDKRGHYWLLYAMRHLGKNRKHAYETVIKMSSEMAHRMSTLDREIAENTRRLQGQNSKVAWIQRNAFIGIGVMDMAVSVPTWIAAYHQAAAAGHSMDVCIRTADSAVRMSQGAGGRKDLSAFARGGSKHTEWQKAAGMFMSYFSALYSRQRNAYKELRQTGREQGVASKEFVADFGRWLMKQMYLVIFPSIAAELLSGRAPEDDEEWLKWAARKSIAGNFGSIPILRDIVGSGIIEGYRYQATPLSSGAEAIINNVTSLGAGFGEDGEWELDKIIKHTSRTAGYSIGLPLEQAVNITGTQVYEMLTDQRDVSLHDIVFRGEPL